MFSLAILIGIYSYLIFLLGVIHLLYPPVIILVTVIFVILSCIYLRKDLLYFKRFLFKKHTPLDRFSKIVLVLVVVICIINLIGALGPETAFDSLWYHLTIPKIFLMQHQIMHIPGSLFYYSDMPKLGEMLYVLPLSVKSLLFAKLVHFTFGILSIIVLYLMSLRFMDRKKSLIAVLIFASNLVFSWESTTAYIDLIRTFFEIMAFWGFTIWYQEKDRKMLMESAVILGLSISTKLIGAGSLIVFPFLIYLFGKDLFKDKNARIKEILKYILVCLAIPMPWFVFAFLNTGNPIYPLITKYYPTSLSLNLINPVYFLKTFFDLFLHNQDPISPLYLILFPLALVFYKKFDKNMKIILAYCILSLIVWYVTPNSGGGRFILPYLPAFSLLSAYLIYQKKELQKFLFFIVFVIAISSIGYRALATAKVVPVVLGFQSNKEYLTKHLNFFFGDFYDTDGFFANNIKSSDTILLYGFHNLYYADFPFIDSSYVKVGDRFNYIATQNANLPERFSFWHLIYQNSTTHVKVYSMGGANWYY